MRLQLFTLSLSLLFFSVSLLAQPINDNCDGLIDLGILPACPDDIYNNIDATASDIGFGNIPTCFEGGTVQNDVWFSFTTNDTLIDLTITVQGTDMGPNSALTNPQIAIYRGDCSFDNLADLGICGSAADGESLVQIDVLGLTPNTPYFIRVNDYSATAAPNWGDFQLCIVEYIPAINIGDSPSSTSCSGTLYDSGGPDEDYQNNENLSFTIQPAEFYACLEIELVDFQLENGFDLLSFYAGSSINDPLIATYTGAGFGDPFTIQSDGPITVQFTSDGSSVQPGFELTWQCSGLACDGSSINNPTEISGLPFDQDGFTTCGAAATFAESPCGNLEFMNGPEYVFAYTSPGGFCADVMVTGAEPGTGLIILDGPPEEGDTECVGQSENGMIFGIDFNTSGTYYIVIANAQGCTDFDLAIEEAECNLNPSLSSSLCNPLNGCIDPSGLPSVFNFNQGFQDIAYNQGVNSGCWLGTGAAQPNFYWFTIEAQAPGPFGFTVQAANPAEASDIDFNVWGPFTNEQVCDDPAGVIDFVENNQPIRSSWAGGADPTGLASIHPVTGINVVDEFDCGGPGTPGAGGDDFVSVIDCQPGEVYAVLINDWGNGIQSGAIEVDWSASADSVLAPIPPVVATADTAICQSDAIQIIVESSVDNIIWLSDTATLSCIDCLDPIATPTETTTYKAIIDAVCYQDTVEVTIEVFNIDAGPDVTVCSNEEIQIVAGSDFNSANYSWTFPAGVSLSCTDCPNPFVTADEAGTYELSVSLEGPDCLLEDEMLLTVLPQEAAEYNISDDLQICVGDNVGLGGDAIAGNTYVWTSNPAGFASTSSNPLASPDTTTTYFLSVSNGVCPVPSLDSVLVEVFTPPAINIAGDTAICQGDPIQLGNMEVEAGAEYNWQGPPLIEDPSNPNTMAMPQQAGTYTLTVTRGACTEQVSVDVDITEIAIEILSEDSLLICRGAEVVLNAAITPADSLTFWTSTDPEFTPTSSNEITVAPETITTYYAQVSLLGGCTKIDSVVIDVDSLPADLSIMPMDTTVCQGEIIVLSSPTYEPSNFEGIAFEWAPPIGFQTPDSLFNMVVTAQDTRTYQRLTTLGVCRDTSEATITVTPTPIISIMPGDTSICPGASVQITAEIIDGDGVFEWTSGTESLSCDDCLDPIATPAANTSYTLEAGEQCPANASVQISVQPPPGYELTNQNFLCEGESVVLNTLIDLTASYTWTSTDPDFGTVTDPAPQVFPSETTTYFLSVTNSPCDTIMDEVTIEVVQTPEIMIMPSALTICEGEELTLAADVINGTPEDLAIWENSNGVEVGQGLEITISPEESDTYILSYISGAECGEFNEEVFIEVLPAPVVNLASSTVICLGESIQLNLESDESTTYTWTSTDPNFTEFDNPEPVVTPAQTATYTLLASNGVCDDIEESVTVEVIGEVSLELIGPNGFICSGDEVVLQALVEGGSSGDIYTWEGSDGTTFTGDSIIVMPDTTTIYDLTYVAGSDCETLTDSITVLVEEGITVDGILIEPEPTYFLGDTISLTALYSTALTDGLIFSWFENDTVLIESGAGLETITQQLLPEVDTSIAYTVTIETPSGCSASFTQLIEVKRPLVDVPNIFTPNGDQHNEFFDVVAEDNRNLLEILEFRVFNRWGQVVYDNETPDTGWDGSLNGNVQPTEAYFYTIKVAYPNGEIAGEFQGNVTLVR